MPLQTLLQLFEDYVRNTTKDAYVKIATIPIYQISHDIPISISTRVLKHAYDKRTAQEFDFLIRHIHDILQSPREIYRNKNGKTGDLCFIKKFDDVRYICVIEKTTSAFEIVTFFRIDERYTEGYELLWEWRMATPHRNVFDNYE